MSLNQNILLEIVNINTRHLHQVLEERIMESQIFSLQWLRDDALIACGANGLLRIFNFTINGAYNTHLFLRRILLLSITLFRYNSCRSTVHVTS